LPSFKGVVTGHRSPSDTKDERAGRFCDRSGFIVASAHCLGQPGALVNFLASMHPDWNISLF
jgi:hypothetical protein